jgi:peptidyl-prolyl cis-trans isomerase B (cyclophilin B)
MKNPIITIEMQFGDIIKAELYADIAPNTVQNFIYLINNDFYNDKIFHRVIESFMIQGGCPEGSGTGDAGYNIKGEFKANGFENSISHEPGVLSMARSQEHDSASCQFFIMHEKAPHLDGNYASFGKVIEGLEIVQKIATVDVCNRDIPREPQVIDRITVETFGVEYDEPEKI